MFSRNPSARFAWPMVAIGGVLAAACLASTWYITRLQTDMARAIRHDAARMDAADELQVQLRHLRFHTLVGAADPSAARRQVIQGDLGAVDAALGAIRRDLTATDAGLFAQIERDYAAYRDRLGPDGFPPPAATVPELVAWSDEHPMRELLGACRELSDRQRARMDAGLERSETQTAWAGGVLLALAASGALGGVLSGYATARALSRRVAQLSVRVQAVQAHLDQEVGAVTVEARRTSDDLADQLDEVVGRVRDVCQRLQEQERDLLRAEQLAAVGHLAAGVAHEVRNPLTGIKLLIDGALRASHPTALTGEDLHLIRHEIARMERTVQGLLDFARTPPPDRRPHDLGALVAEAASVVRGRAAAKPVSLAATAPREPVTARVDRDQMLSLLTNLLLNGIEATPPGGTVAVRVGRDGGGILVEVTDSGPGIDAAIANRLFTPFATTKPTGTGLGLTIARRVARGHGGALTGANRPGGGAAFTLTLPAAEVPNGEAAGR
ncbi:sensor histidine kinase [Gemmata sp.]|uniref:sensor histidine kinase n=1 Tax=Gemmata sp. TaxID=1914242 RepID=UPI003F71F318